MVDNLIQNSVQRDVMIEGLYFPMQGKLVIPSGAKALVLFAHGSGSSRFSPRNSFVAEVLQRRGIGTLLLDLLSEEEAEDRSFVFDLDLLAERLIHAKNWLRGQIDTSGLGVGYFGSSTGGGAALVAAARDPENVFAVVSRGGRPDLAMRYLSTVTPPTLLIVGENDDVVLTLNRQAFTALHCTKKLEIIPGATHLFEEPGTLEQVAELAASWFVRYQAPIAQKTAG